MREAVQALPLVVLAAGLAACVPQTRLGPASQDQVWPVYLGDPARATTSTESLSADPQPIWRVGLGRGVSGNVAITEDVIAASQRDQQITLLDRSTGEVVWRRRVGGHLGGGPLIADDRLFAGTQSWNGQVVALRLTDGHRIWATDAGDVAAPLAFARGSIYAGTVDGWALRLDAATGRRIWRVQLPGAMRAAPVPAPDGVLVAVDTDTLFLLDEGTGAVRVRVGVGGSVLAAPALAGNLVIVGTTAGVMRAFDVATLAPAWQVELGGRAVGHIAVYRDTAYALTTRGALWRVPLSRPDAASSVATGIVTRAGPTPVAEGVFVCAVEGDVRLLGPDGAVRWSVHTRGPLIEPVVVDGHTFYVVGQRGELVAFR